MAFCSKCGTQVNDGTKFCPKCGNPMENSASSPNGYQQQAYQPQQPYAAQVAQHAQQKPMKPNTHMVFAILSTILCCLPTGIYAIVMANKVDKLYYAEDYEGAEKASQDAKKWSIIGAVLAVIGWIIYVFFVGGLAFLGAMSGVQ